MTFIVKSSYTVKKTPLIQATHEASPEHVIEMPAWSARRSATALFCTTVSAFLVTLAGVATGLMLYRHYIRTTAPHRYQGFCTIPINRDPYFEPNYRVMPLQWSSEPEVQLFNAISEESEELASGLREQFDIGDTLEKISVMDNGRQVSFIHDFDLNVTGIVDSDRCFTMALDRSVVVAPDALVVSIVSGEQFDVSRVRAALRALLPPAPPAPAPRALALACIDKPVYSLARDDSVIIRKRAADAPSHDYIQFSGRKVQEIEITNLADLLQHEQDAQQL